MNAHVGKLAGLLLVIVQSMSGSAQPLAGQIVCSLVIGQPGSSTNYGYSEIQRWSTFGNAVACSSTAGAPLECTGYDWRTQGAGAKPDPMPIYSIDWRVEGSGPSATGFQRRQVGSTTIVHQNTCCVPSSEWAPSTKAMPTGLRSEWKILWATADAPDLVLPATGRGSFTAKVEQPAYQSGPGTRDVHCLYAFGATGAGQIHPTAVKRDVGAFDLFALDPLDTSKITRKSFAGVWGPGSMGADWGATSTGAGPPGGFVLAAPAAVSLSPSEVHVVAIGADGLAYHNMLGAACVPSCPAGGAWTPLGGPATGVFEGAVAALATGPDKLELFARSSEGIVYRKTRANGMWTPAATAGWQSIGTGGALVSAPAAVSWESDRFDVFARGSDGLVYHKFYPTRWNTSGPGSEADPWESLGGPPMGVLAIGAPAAVSWAPHRLDIFIAGEDGHVYHKYYASGWGSPGAGSLTGTWESLGGPPTGVNIIGSPVAVSWESGRLDIFVTGDDGNIYHKYHSTSWGPGDRLADWEIVGTNLQRSGFSSAPAVVTWGPNRLDVVAIGRDAKPYHKWFEGTWRLGRLPGTWELIAAP